MQFDLVMCEALTMRCSANVQADVEYQLSTWRKIRLCSHLSLVSTTGSRCAARSSGRVESWQDAAETRAHSKRPLAGPFAFRQLGKLGRDEVDMS